MDSFENKENEYYWRDAEKNGIHPDLAYRSQHISMGYLCKRPPRTGYRLHGHSHTNPSRFVHQEMVESQRINEMKAVLKAHDVLLDLAFHRFPQMKVTADEFSRWHIARHANYIQIIWNSCFARIGIFTNCLDDDAAHQNSLTFSLNL